MTATEPVDQTIAAIGLPHHPPMKDIIDHLRDAADRLASHGRPAATLATTLAANGYPSRTLGDGGSRGTDDTSSTERKAIEDPDDWAGIDRRLATALGDASRTAKALDALVQNILHHAEDVDPVPVGTGYCQACSRFCRPDKDRPGNRLRAGLCPTDYRAWLRADQPNHSDWVRTRKDVFTDEHGVVHTPEPDHDIDLSSESLSP